VIKLEVEKRGDNLQERDFWKRTRKEFGYKYCCCGKKMGVIMLGPLLCYCCEECPHTINLTDKDYENAKNRKATMCENNKYRGRK